MGLDVLAIATDMIFGQRILSTAQRLGRSCEVARTDQDVEQMLVNCDARTLILVDMECAEPVPDRAITKARDLTQGSRIIAYYPHVRDDLRQAALKAGADSTLPRSAFVQQLSDILERGSE